jgi:hypothetical protein
MNLNNMAPKPKVERTGINYHTLPWIHLDLEFLWPSAVTDSVNGSYVSLFSTLSVFSRTVIMHVWEKRNRVCLWISQIPTIFTEIQCIVLTKCFSTYTIWFCSWNINGFLFFQLENFVQIYGWFSGENYSSKLLTKKLWKSHISLLLTGVQFIYSPQFIYPFEWFQELKIRTCAPIDIWKDLVWSRCNKQFLLECDSTRVNFYESSIEDRTLNLQLQYLIF